LGHAQRGEREHVGCATFNRRKKTKDEDGGHRGRWLYSLAIGPMARDCGEGRRRSELRFRHQNETWNARAFGGKPVTRLNNVKYSIDSTINYASDKIF